MEKGSHGTVSIMSTLEECKSGFYGTESGEQRRELFVAPDAPQRSADVRKSEQSRRTWQHAIIVIIIIFQQQAVEKQEDTAAGMWHADGHVPWEQGALELKELEQSVLTSIKQRQQALQVLVNAGEFGKAAEERVSGDTGKHALERRVHL